MTRRRRAEPGAIILTTFVALAIIAIAFGARFLIAGQDLGCVFAEDPALCAAVKGVGE